MKDNDLTKKRPSRWMPLVMLLGALMLSLGAAAQQVASGVVVGGDQKPLIGATVIEKGTTNGMTTGLDGKFSLKVAPGATILVSYIGYETREIPAANAVSATIVLSEESTMMENLVVVGYGAQKKENLTGAVASINIADMVDGRPVTSVSSALSGLSPGLYVQQATGRPNADGSNLLLRGQGTLSEDVNSASMSKAAPMIVIDGMVSTMSDMNALNPMDIEQISLLKDAASSSIYGSRAANGVILVKTRQGAESRFTINYAGYWAMAQPSNTIETVSNYADYMTYYNEAQQNSSPGASPQYKDATIRAWLANDDPLRYPNTDWRDEIFQNGVINNHSLSFSGGSKEIRAFGSFGYLHNPGIIENSTYEQYNGRINVSADVRKWLTLGVNARGSVGDAEMGSKAMSNLFGGIGSPGIVYRHPDGRYGGAEATDESQQIQSPLYAFNSRQGNIVSRAVQSRFFGTIRPMKGLTVEGAFNYSYTDITERETPLLAEIWSFQRNVVIKEKAEHDYARNRLNESVHVQGEVIARYSTTFAAKRLSFDAMAGASQEKTNAGWFEAQRYDLIDPNLTSINAATGEQIASGVDLGEGYAMRSYFGRVNLAWENKYLLEANLRVDQSSKFAPDYRTGWFPSVSAGWRIDQEKFFEPLKKVVSSLKLRASYGSLGNENIGNYQYQSNYTKDPYVLNYALANGMTYTLSNAAIQWESTYLANLGIDVGLFNNRLEGTFEVFDKMSKNVLAVYPAPLLVGTAKIPASNGAHINNRGLELSLKWRDRIGKDFNYYVSGNFSYIRNEVTKYKGDERTVSGANLVQEGHPINVQYVYRVSKIVKDSEDVAYVQQMIDNAPYGGDGKKLDPFAAVGGRPGLGDFLYTDINGDGVINDDDKVLVGFGQVPPITYGAQLGCSWKGIDFSVMLQGIKGYKWLWQDNFNMGYLNYGGPINKEWAENAWRPSNPEATMPRLNIRGTEQNNVESDYWVADKSYMRIKNIQLGYQFPKKWTEKIQVSSARIYVSLENFFTFTNYKGIDPEVSGTNYPTLKQTVFGVNINF